MCIVDCTVSLRKVLQVFRVLVSFHIRLSINFEIKKCQFKIDTVEKESISFPVSVTTGGGTMNSSVNALSCYSWHSKERNVIGTGQRKTPRELLTFWRFTPAFLNYLCFLLSLCLTSDSLLVRLLRANTATRMPCTPGAQEMCLLKEQAVEFVREDSMVLFAFCQAAQKTSGNGNDKRTLSVALVWGGRMLAVLKGRKLYMVCKKT